MKMKVKISSICWMTMPFLATLSVFVYFRSSVQICSQAKIWDRRVDKNDVKKDHGHFQHTQFSRQKSLSDLFDPGTDEKVCLSKFESSLYRANPPQKSSPYLLSKLRAYEALHRRCSPNTQPYNETLKRLELDRNVGPTSDCNYVVYIPSRGAGLGNWILSIASAFLYALLTNRVLLVEFENDMSNLFCEPIPKVTWLLPKSFPMRGQFHEMNKRYPQSFGNMIMNHNLSTNGTTYHDQALLPSYIYLHLIHDYTSHDKLFFCDDYQHPISKVPWLFLQSNQYFVPSLFLMPNFDQELAKLFPEKETVFNHLGRYLFNPSNNVWSIVKRYYNAYLARADEIIGIQIRTFDIGHYEHFMDQILACSIKEKLLPQVVDENNDKNISQQTTNPKHKAVLITSLSSSYFENLKDLYLKNPSQTEDVIGFYQPSHEEIQRTDKFSHNSKAWVEMYLLSLVDVLVTSAWSTFGYVAQGLGGLRPWVLLRPTEPIVPDPPCLRVASMEPCFHFAPTYDCKTKNVTDTGSLVPHVKHCEDVSEGLKLVDHNFH